MNLDWQNIRPLNGGRDKGFEELCAQLARSEVPSQSVFVRKATPDAGVECYAAFADGSEWGWQSKYFDSLGDSQWAQIDDSVKTALTKHPSLVRYYVCVPLDRPDGRIEGRMSAKERWDAHVVRWNERASALGMNVDFVFWGGSELIERLSRTEHVGRVRFWFDVHGFDAAWFGDRLEEAVKTAGPRYTPEIHIDLPIADDFEAFGRTQRFFDREKARARSLREKFRSCSWWDGPSDPSVDAAMAQLSTSVTAVLNELGSLSYQPTGPLRFEDTLEKIRSATAEAEKAVRIVDERDREYRAQQSPAKPDEYRARSPYLDRRINLLNLVRELESLDEALVHANRLAEASVLILNGSAGTGKTHLLCDISRNRIGAGFPTVLLMGQQFVNNEAPWHQVFQQLDLSGLSGEAFIGALEAAAQAANSRALLLIDALNEGTGRAVWPNHLSAFLTQVERSSWIGVVLSVRSSYEQVVIPENVRTAAVSVTHRGFSDKEYDATKTFFIYYGLELPSTPLLAPEFRNPLFLKTLCRGLNAMGERRMPRGLQGITAVFDLFLRAVDERLGAGLNFDPRTQLVRRSLQAVSDAMLDVGERWLPLASAVGTVDAFLPGRGFEGSLYRGLVAEGVLVEEVARVASDHDGEVVFIGYERFADHVTAKTLLDKHLDLQDPAAAFVSGAPLASLYDESKYVPPGLIEALCIQVPERTSKELASLSPAFAERWGFGDAFRQSLVWRAHSAFSDETHSVLNKLVRSDHDQSDTFDVLLTVATLPEHPFNAGFLDSNLRKMGMADRDAWWSIYIHSAWRSGGAVDRLVDWAWSIDANSVLDEDAVYLCATALAWMLTSSNRFLRDRATKALVNLLTGRLGATRKMVESFADVDDPYVAERVYAVAYGVTMRSGDVLGIGALAESVYDRVFSTGIPPPQVLLRDYARGVVERALYLNATTKVDAKLCRPPYRSSWPNIPTQEDIKPLLPDWSKGAHDSGQLEWARNRIASSIMSDDFGHYVIGTNSSSTARDWLSLTLDAPPWTPPPDPNKQLQALKKESAVTQRLNELWEKFEEADQAHSFVSVKFIWTTPGKGETVAQDSNSEPPLTDSDAVGADSGKERDASLDALSHELTDEHAQRLSQILESKKSYWNARQAPHLELALIQRYVLWRVFDLGWTIERFGRFDRFSIGHYGRDASKAERLGKKYQWIAYHEILALISDRFQYKEPFTDDRSAQLYDGPWQDHLRDIDPSCTMRSLRGGTSWSGHEPAWWGPSQYTSWGEPDRQRDWVLKTEDLPTVDELLTAVDPSDGTLWVNGEGYFNWKQQPPADREGTEVERREIWYIATGYLVKAEEADAFLEWAEAVDFWGRWMPDAPEVYRMFLGEYGWAPADLPGFFGPAITGKWHSPGHQLAGRSRSGSCRPSASDSADSSAVVLRCSDAAIVR